VSNNIITSNDNDVDKSLIRATRWISSLFFSLLQDINWLSLCWFAIAQLIRGGSQLGPECEKDRVDSDGMFRVGTLEIDMMGGASTRKDDQEVHCF